MSKHSPPPWRVESWDAVTLAWLKSHEGTADRALIDAAPDLLAAAKRALSVLKAQGESVRPGNALGALDAAIAKAEAR